MLFEIIQCFCLIFVCFLQMYLLKKVLYLVKIVIKQNQYLLDIFFDEKNKDNEVKNILEDKERENQFSETSSDSEIFDFNF